MLRPVGEERRVDERAREVGVADAGRDELQRDVLELDLDLGLQAEAERLRTLGELPADRVVVGRLGVVEDQGRRREPLDRGGLARALGIGADVDDLVADDRADVELVVVDRQHDQPGLELPAPDAVGDRRRVVADQPHRHVRMPAQERDHELVDTPRRRAAEDADRDRAGLQLVELGRRCRPRPRRRAGCAWRARRTRGRPRSATTPRPARTKRSVAERLLELADLLGHRGLRHPQRLGRGGERAELERGAEAADLLQRQKLSFGLRQEVRPTSWASGGGSCSA